MNERDIRIRVATPEDAPSLTGFGARVFEETFGADNRPQDVAMYLAETYGTVHQARELADPDVSYLVAEVDGGMAGYALVRRGAAPACVGSPLPLEIVRFYVDRPFHGSGVSRQLMDACIAGAARAGATALWLGVWERNARAIRFYEKCGFRGVGFTTFVLGTDAQTDRVMMRER